MHPLSFTKSCTRVEFGFSMPIKRRMFRALGTVPIYHWEHTHTQPHTLYGAIQSIHFTLSPSFQTQGELHPDRDLNQESPALEGKHANHLATVSPCNQIFLNSFCHNTCFDKVFRHIFFIYLQHRFDIKKFHNNIRPMYYYCMIIKGLCV